MSPGGRDLTLITDRGNLATARLTRTGGRITAIALTSRVRMAFANGRLLRGTIGGDAEGIAMTAHGDILISFEQRHRVARYDPQSERTHRLPHFADFDAFQNNSGLEALAVHPDGTLLAIPEKPPGQGKGFPLYALKNDAWVIKGYLPKRGPFLPVGADVDALGRLYLLERTVGPLGFRSRIRRFALNDADWPEETLLRTTVGTYDNLEGLTVWQDETGQTRLTAVSDNNFLSLLKTQIVEFILTE